MSLGVVAVQEEKGKSMQFSDVASLMAGRRGRVNVEREGNIDDGIWSAGQSMGLIHDIPSTADLMKTFMGEAEEILRSRLHNMLVSKI